MTARSWPGGPRTLGALAALCGAQVQGDPDSLVSGLANPEGAGPDDLVFLIEPQYQDRVLVSAGGYVLSDGSIDDRPGLRHPRPREALLALLGEFTPAQPEPGVHPTAWVDPTAQVSRLAILGPGAVVGPRAVVGEGTVLEAHVVLYQDVRVGKFCHLHSGTVVREDCILGDRVVLQPGVVVGSDGFGFVPTSNGIKKIPQVGNVIIADDVEIGANATIDRAVLGSTVIGRGTKLDNLVHLAHNVKIGSDCMLVAQVGISGSTAIGDRCVFGGQSGSVGHVRIGDDVTVAARSGITKDIASGPVTVSGFPARPHREELRRQAALNRLAGLVK